MASTKQPSTTALDRAAVLLSGLCLVHCLTLPFALMFGPLLGQWLLDSETEVHWVLLALALPISAIALGRGYLRHHSWLTLVLGGAGLMFMFAGAAQLFGAHSEVLLTVVGVSALLLAHIRNMVAAHGSH